MRLDRFLCELNMGSRSRVKEAVRQGVVTVNGNVVKTPDFQIVPEEDNITFQGRELTYHRFVYYMLNKPKGVVSATRDNTADTVCKLIPNPLVRDLFPVGRLDKDTEGLLLLTNDGELSHRLLSPRYHVAKTYHVGLREELSEEAVRRLTEGVDIGDDKPTAPAKAEILSPLSLSLTIYEGRFHQVKRMLQAVGNEVVSLKRVAFGPLVLDESLAPGESRLLTEEEVTLFHAP